MEYIVLPDETGVDLAGFLIRKLSEREQAARARREKFTQADLAGEIGIEPTTLSSMMNPKEPAKRISFVILQKLIRAFGREFTDEFGLTPPDL